MQISVPLKQISQHQTNYTIHVHLDQHFLLCQHHVILTDKKWKMQSEKRERKSGLLMENTAIHTSFNNHKLYFANRLGKNSKMCLSITFLNSTFIQYAGNFTWDLFNIGQISVYLRENIPSIFFFKVLVYYDVLFIGMLFFFF